MTNGSVAIGATVRAAVSGLAPAVRACWVALLAAVVISVLTRALPVALAGLAPLGHIAALTLACGALYRHAFNRPAGVSGLWWGRDEWRLLGMQALIAALLLVVSAVLILAVGAVALGVARANAPGFDATSAAAWRDALGGAGPGTVVAGAAPLLGLAVLVWLCARLSLSAAATVDQSGVRVLSVFPWTRGVTLQILIACVILAAPFAALWALASLAGRWAGPGFDTVQAALGAILGYVYLAPVWTGALVHVYRRRHPSAASPGRDL